MPQQKIFCVIPDNGAVFSVKVASDDTVDDLKKAIKKEKSQMLANVDADTLTLYRVAVAESISGQKQERIKELKRLFQNLNECTLLDDEEQRVSEFYGRNSDGKRDYILVQPPTGESCSSRACAHTVDALSLTCCYCVIADDSYLATTR